MQMNGGFFGSMMPQGASSFMPSGPSGMSMTSGVGGTPDAFTSPPMGGDLMAALAALSKMSGQGQGGNNSAALPPNSFSPWDAGAGAAPANGAPPPAPPGGPAAAPPAAGAQAGGPPMNGILQMLQKMNPDQLKGIIQRLGIGGGMSAPAGG